MTFRIQIVSKYLSDTLLSFWEIYIAYAFFLGHIDLPETQ